MSVEDKPCVAAWSASLCGIPLLLYSLHQLYDWYKARQKHRRTRTPVVGFLSPGWTKR